ncbi:MAG: hypothetical protein ABI857_03680 [Acidobacteriota bacterium]
MQSRNNNGKAAAQSARPAKHLARIGVKVAEGARIILTRSKHIALGAIALLAAILLTAAPVSAQTSTVTDPVGDTYLNNAPAFQDIVFARMTKTASGDFELLMEMAGPVPVAPTVPPQGHSEIWWNFIFDLDPATAPQGYPTPPGIPFLAEFILYVSWDGAEFAGTAVDRRPLLAGGEAIITPVPFRINGTIVEADLASELIGAVPPSFRWRPNTIDWAGPFGSEGRNVVDNAVFTIFNP